MEHKIGDRLLLNKNGRDYVGVVCAVQTKYEGDFAGDTIYDVYIKGEGLIAKLTSRELVGLKKKDEQSRKD